MLGKSTERQNDKGFDLVFQGETNGRLRPTGSRSLAFFMEKIDKMDHVSTGTSNHQHGVGLDE
jgi:hypothetical protein